MLVGAPWWCWAPITQRGSRTHATPTVLPVASRAFSGQARGTINGNYQPITRYHDRDDPTAPCEPTNYWYQSGQATCATFSKAKQAITTAFPEINLARDVGASDLIPYAAANHQGGGDFTTAWIMNDTTAFSEFRKRRLAQQAAIAASCHGRGLIRKVVLEYGVAEHHPHAKDLRASVAQAWRGAGVEVEITAASHFSAALYGRDSYTQEDANGLDRSVDLFGHRVRHPASRGEAPVRSTHFGDKALASGQPADAAEAAYRLSETGKMGADALRATAPSKHGPQRTAKGVVVKNRLQQNGVMATDALRATAPSKHGPQRTAKGVVVQNRLQQRNVMGGTASGDGQSANPELRLIPGRLYCKQDNQWHTVEYTVAPQYTNRHGSAIGRVRLSTPSPCSCQQRLLWNGNTACRMDAGDHFGGNRTQLTMCTKGGGAHKLTKQ